VLKKGPGDAKKSLVGKRPKKKKKEICPAELGSHLVKRIRKAEEKKGGGGGGERLGKSIARHEIGCAYVYLSK